MIYEKNKNYLLKCPFGWKNGKKHVFKVLACVTGGKCFLGTHKVCAKKSSSCLLKSELQNKSMKHKKREKKRVWNLDAGHKIENSLV